MDIVKLKILVAVKTYPTPSTRYREIVCTAGVREDGRWVRLYPIDYRYRDYAQRYKKYDWIELIAEKNSNDPRPESFRPRSNIKIVGWAPTKNKWAERRKYVLANGTRTMCWLQQQSQKDISLSAVKPVRVEDFYWKAVSKEWSPKQAQTLNQLNLFQKNKQLEKIPFKFQYRFRCEEPHCRGHNMMIEDWEVMELYRRMRDKYGEEKGLGKVKDNFLTEMCSNTRDTYFIVGTVLQYETWLILSVFWPPR